jgi:hypothetical protein
VRLSAGSVLDAQIESHSAVAVDDSGNIYLSQFDRRIRKISAGGIITTVVGTGTEGSLAKGLAVNEQIDPLSSQRQTTGSEAKYFPFVAPLS